MWGSTCRTCGGAEGAEPLWGGASCAGRLLPGVTQLRPARGDRLPALVCRACLRRLRQAAAFSRACSRAHRRLLRRLAPSPHPHPHPAPPLEPARPAPLRILPRPAPAHHTCNKCNAKFISAECLQTHGEQHHFEISPARNCSTCGIAFENAAELTRHNLEIHFPSTDPSKKAICGLCKKKYKNKYLLARHKKKAHPENDENFKNPRKKYERTRSEGIFKNHVALDDRLKFPNGEFIEKVSPANVAVSQNCRAEDAPKRNLSPPPDSSDADRIPIAEKDDRSSADLLGTPAISKSEPSTLADEQTDDKDAYDIIDCDIGDDSVTNMFDLGIERSASDIAEEIAEEKINLVDDRSTEIFNDPDDNFKENFSIESDHTYLITNMLKYDDKLTLYNLKDHSVDEVNVLDKNRSLLNASNLNGSTFTGATILSSPIECKPKIEETSPKKDAPEECTESPNKNAITSTARRKSLIDKYSEASQCKVCSKKFLRLFNLQKHMSIHKNEPPRCVGCDYEATDQNDLKQHLRQCRAHRSTTNLECPKCGKALTTAAGLRYHLQAHTGIRRHVCPICQRHFLTVSNLKSHTRSVHSRLRPHKCALCSRAFSTRDHLRKHNAGVHTCQRDHACSLCGQRFKQSSHLTQHMNAHTGIKPHRCLYCSNKYTAKGSLTKHLRRYHLEKQKQKAAAVQSENQDCESNANLELNIASLAEDGIVILDDEFTDGVNVVIIVEDRDSAPEYEKNIN